MGWLQKYTGHQRERQAKQWLEQQDVSIIKANFHCKGGEIDLIGHHQNTLIFFEVKSRKNAEFGHPLEHITAQKQRRLYQCAEFFLKTHPQHTHLSFRFDAITFLGNDTPEWHQNIIGF